MQFDLSWRVASTMNRTEVCTLSASCVLSSTLSTCNGIYALGKADASQEWGGSRVKRSGPYSNGNGQAEFDWKFITFCNFLHRCCTTILGRLEVCRYPKMSYLPDHSVHRFLPRCHSCIGLHDADTLRISTVCRSTSRSRSLSRTDWSLVWETARSRPSYTR